MMHILFKNPIRDRIFEGRGGQRSINVDISGSETQIIILFNNTRSCIFDATLT